MANQYRLGNQHNEESSPYRNAVYLRLFGSNISIINGGPRSVSSIPAIGGQIGARPTEPAARSDYQRSGVVAGNSSNVNSISSFNDGINTTTTGTRNDDLFRANSLLKRSRSPDPFTRGETSNKGLQVDPSPSSSVPPRQPITTLDPTRSNNYQLNLPPSPLGSGFTIAAQTDQYIQTSSRSPRSDNAASHGSIYHNFISSSHELRPERNTLRIENFLVLDYWATQNRRLHSQERIDRMTNLEDWLSDDWLDKVMKAGLREEEIFECIQHETYQPNIEETSTMNQTCTICQEDYSDGERIGRLDCIHGHRYHLDCISQWLEVKNVCPVCKEIALRIYDEDE